MFDSGKLYTAKTNITRLLQHNFDISILLQLFIQNSIEEESFDIDTVKFCLNISG